MSYPDQTRTKVLVVGLRKEQALVKSLPVRLMIAKTGTEAIRLLRGHRVIDVIVSRWDLPDMADGNMLRLLRAARPSIPQVVLLDQLYKDREIVARSLGVVAVLPADVAPAQLWEVLADVLEPAKTVPTPQPGAGRRGKSVAAPAAKEQRA